MATILVIDDDGRAREAIRDLLAALGHTVLDTDDGAIDLATLPRLDLVLVDVFMPHMDGFETLNRLRRCAPDLPVVMMTGDPHFGGMDVLQVARQLGARTALAKPLDMAKLAAAVESALRTRAPSSGDAARS